MNSRCQFYNRYRKARHAEIGQFRDLKFFLVEWREGAKHTKQVLRAFDASGNEYVAGFYSEGTDVDEVKIIHWGMIPSELRSFCLDDSDVWREAITFQQVLTFFDECKYDKEKGEFYCIKSDERYWFDVIERKTYAYDRENRCYSQNVETGKYDVQVEHQHTNGFWIDSSESECVKEWGKLERGELGEGSFKRLFALLTESGANLDHFKFFRINDGNDQGVVVCLCDGKRFVVTITQDGQEVQHRITEAPDALGNRGLVPMFANDAKRYLKLCLNKAFDALVSRRSVCGRVLK